MLCERALLTGVALPLQRPRGGAGGTLRRRVAPVTPPAGGAAGWVWVVDISAAVLGRKVKRRGNRARGCPSANCGMGMRAQIARRFEFGARKSQIAIERCTCGATATRWDPSRSAIGDLDICDSHRESQCLAHQVTNFYFSSFVTPLDEGMRGELYVMSLGVRGGLFE